MNELYRIKFPNRVIAGPGCAATALTTMIPAGEGGVAVLTDEGVASGAFFAGLKAALNDAGVAYTLLTDLPSEPTVDQVQALYQRMLPLAPKQMVAVGGGSVIDLSKLMACALRNPALMEQLPDTACVSAPSVPLMAIPTTSGSGSEATANAIVLFPEQALKIGVIHDAFIPQTVVLDPLATVGLPPRLTASTGVDALCHCMESYISKLNNPFSETFALEGFRLIAANLETAYRDGENLEARAAMQRAAFYGGLCLTSSCTVAVHALSYPLGGAYHIPHGVSNAILLPQVMSANLDTIREKLCVLAPLLLPDCQRLPRQEWPEATVAELEALVRRLGIPRSLTGFGIARDNVPFLARQAQEVKRLLGQNPKELTLAEIEGIYETLV